MHAHTHAHRGRTQKEDITARSSRHRGQEFNEKWLVVEYFNISKKR